MPVELLGIGKLVLLALMYLFIWRVVQAVSADLRDPVATDEPRPAPRPQVAQPDRRAPARRPPTSLVLHPDDGAPRAVELAGARIVFGRADHVDQMLADDFVSDEHAELTSDGSGEWRIRDLGSTNGTYLNGRKVIASTAVAAGDQLQLGKTRIEVRR
jgi:hypothetical protein